MASLMGEKEMNISPSTSFQQNFEFETKVKWVKTGKRKTEGWRRKVVRIPLCQQASRPTRKPGRKKVEKVMVAAPARSVPQKRTSSDSSAVARATPLLMNVRLHAPKMRRKRGERSPLRCRFCCSRIRDGPTFRFLASPREEVMTDEEKPKRKRTESKLSTLCLSKMISLPSALVSNAVTIK